MNVSSGKWCHYYLNLSISYLIIICLSRYKLKEYRVSMQTFPKNKNGSELPLLRMEAEREEETEREEEAGVGVSKQIN